MNTLLWLLVVICAAGLASGLLLLFIPSRLHKEHIASSQVHLEKTRLEVEDLRYGWMRTLGTALLTVVIAVGGWLIQQLLAHEDVVAREAMELHDTYIRNLGDLGDPKPIKRIAASTYLSNVYQRLTDLADQKQLIDTLVYQYANEQDAFVRSYMRGQLLAMTNAGSLILVAAADQDRNLTSDYATLAGDALRDQLHISKRVGVRMPSVCLPKFSPDSDVLDVRSSDTSDAERAMCHAAHLWEDFDFEMGTLHFANGYAGAALGRGVFATVYDAPGYQNARYVRMRLHRVYDSLFATGALLADLLNAGFAREGQDLHDVYIPTGTWLDDQVNLSHADLHGATIFSAYSSLNVRFANLSNSDLGLVYDGVVGSFTGADLYGAIIGTRATFATSDFRGSNLVQALAFDGKDLRNATVVFRVIPSYKRSVVVKELGQELPSCVQVYAPQKCAWSDRGELRSLSNVPYH